MIGARSLSSSSFSITGGGGATTTCSFDGADRIQHGITFEITVERSAAFPGVQPTWLRRLRRLPAVAEPIAAGSKSSAPVTVSGTMIRLVPDGLARAVDASPPAGAVATARPFRMPQQVRVDARGNTTLGARMRAALADPRLLGRPGVHEHRAELHNAVSPVALSVFLPRMVGTDGHFVGRFPVPGRPTQFVEVGLRARLYEEDVVVFGRNGIEIRTVFRDQGTAGAGETTGQLRRASGGGEFTAAGVGVNISASYGEQGSRRVAGSGGLRSETTLYEKGTVSTVRVRADYELVLRRVTVRDGVVGRTRHEVRVPAGSGTAYVTGFDADGVAPYTGVRFGRTVPAESRVTRRSGQAWPVALWGPGPTAQAGGTTYSSGGVGGGPLAVGGLPARVVRAVLRILPWHVARTRRVSLREEFPSLSHDPPGDVEIVTWGAGAVGALRRAGVRDPAERLIAFGLRHPVHAPHGVIVLFRHVLEELNSLVESGRLDPEWFADLIAYEVRFRIDGHTYAADGRSREAVAADLLERLERARRAVRAEREPVAPVRRGRLGAWPAGAIPDSA